MSHLPCKNLKTALLGFTLAELLISLAILGVIATFTIPKILSTQQNSQKSAIFKEIISAISNVTYTGNQTNVFTYSSYRSYVLNNLNLIKICQTNSATQNCHPSAMAFGMEILPGGVFANGATISIIDRGDNESAGFLIDWNGDLGSNTLGDDQLFVFSPYTNTSWWYSSQYKVMAVWDDSGPNAALRNQVFSP